ncbi:MAG: hypothetical protein IJT12_05775 [Paludibacteraceae bacterium]|nr:hypothetical protein [Paludibacteraceae bacterium]
MYSWEEPKQKPYAMYIHGFASSPKSGTRASLARALPEYEWLAPEITHEPFESLGILNEWARTFLPQLIVGTSMGGMLAMYVDAPEATKIAVNPSLEMERTLRKMGYGKHPYLQEREDGATEFVIDEPMIQRFVAFKKEHAFISGIRNIGLFSTDDELLGHEMSKRNAKVLEDNGCSLIWSNKFGHRCNDNAVKEIVKVVRVE